MDQNMRGNEAVKREGMNSSTKREGLVEFGVQRARTVCSPPLLPEKP